MKNRWRAIGIGLLGAVLFLAAWIGVAVLLHDLHVPARAGEIILAIAGFAVYIAYVRATERRPISELEPRRAPTELVFGFLFGLTLFGVVIGVLAATGHYRVTSFGNPSALLSGLVMWFSGAVMEELLFRGFIFRVVQNVAGTWVGVAVSALLFGLIHAANPGSSIFSSLAIALEAGVLLALAYAMTNRLWLPIGIHAGWNYAEGTIFGTAVSGGSLKSSLLHGTLTGNALLTGGAFGVEASIVAIPVCLAAAAFLALKVMRHRLVEAPA